MGPISRAILLALVTITAALLVPREHVYDLLAIFLATAAGVYVGLGLADESANESRLQWAVALFFAGLAFLGLWLSPLLLAAGWLLHAGWDWLHHVKKMRTFAPGGYPVFCAVYDVVVGGFVLVYYLI